MYLHVLFNQFKKKIVFELICLDRELFFIIGLNGQNCKNINDYKKFISAKLILYLQKQTQLLIINKVNNKYFYINNK